MKTETSKLQKQGKISVVWICLKYNEVLIYTRKKQPFYNHQGFLSGKVQYGETIYEAAKRELYEETGLTCEPELFRIEHQIVMDDKSGDLLEDKYFYMFRGLDPIGKIVPNEEGIFEWIKKSM